MIIAVGSLQRIKPCAANRARGIINGEMEMPDLNRRGRVHLLHFAEISASGVSGMSVFDCHKIGLDGVGFLLGRSEFLFSRSSFLIRFLFAFVTLGERIYWALSMVETEETERRIPSCSSRSSL